jgi:hypothetical protein
LGIVIDVRYKLLPLLNAPLKILEYPIIITVVVADPRPAVTISGVKSPVPEKVTVGGRTVLTPDLPKNSIPVAGADLPRVVAVAGDKVTVVNPDDANTLYPIIVTELGIVIDVNMEHSWNA